MSKYSGLFQPGEALSLAINIIATGFHTGSDNASVLTDTREVRKTFPFTADVIGRTIYNITDGSKGTITAQTVSTVTATLAGGTDNDFDTGDFYIIGESALEVLEVPQLREIGFEAKTVVTSGTAVSPTSNKKAKAVRVVNNNIDGRIVYLGLTAAGVDGSSSPPKGVPIDQRESHIMYVDADANEVKIDSDTNSTVVGVYLLGI